MIVAFCISRPTVLRGSRTPPFPFQYEHKNRHSDIPIIAMHKKIRYIQIMIDPKLLRGSLDTIILKLLDENEEMYGYEITQKVKEITAGEMKLTEGALYPALHRLEGKGILSTDIRSIGNRMRKYYRLTESGKTEVNTQLAAMQDFIASINLILKPKIA